MLWEMAQNLPTPADSKKVKELEAAAENAPKGRTPEFNAALQAAQNIESEPVTIDDLPLVHCRRCGGTGQYRTMRGWEKCAGHDRCGVCRGGRSLGPRERAIMVLRVAEASLSVRRRQWKAVAALTPITRSDHRRMINALRSIERQGHFAANSVAAASKHVS